jgi:hypothetical protein
VFWCIKQVISKGFYLKKRTCESEYESCGDAGPEPEPVSSEGDTSQVDRDSVDWDDELGEHQVDQDQIERRSELKYEKTLPIIALCISKG